MEWALQFGRIWLASTFAAAGFLKVADLSGTARGIEGFGVAGRFARALAAPLALSELLCAGLLVIGRTSNWGAWGAALLLGVFSVGIAYNLAAGRRPSCGCFGMGNPKLIGWPTLLRNLSMLAASLAIGFFGSVPLPEDAGPGGVLGSSYGATGVAVAIATLAFLAWTQLRRNLELTQRVEELQLALEDRWRRGASDQRLGGLEIGSPAPKFALPDLHGKEWSLSELLNGSRRPLLLLFVDPSCDRCRAVARDLREISTGNKDLARLVAVTTGSWAENKAMLGDLETSLVLVQRHREVAAAYSVRGTPSALIVDAGGRIATRLAEGASDVRRLAFRGRAATETLRSEPAV